MVRQRAPDAPAVLRAVAERLPFADGAFDAAMSVLSIHHWADVSAGLREMARVAGRVVVLTFDPVVHGTLWLFTEYLPESPSLASSNPPSPEAVAEIIGAERVETVGIPADCVDGFNWAYWRRPEAYLDPVARSCMSGLALLDDDLVARRMEQLRADLSDGTWHARHRDLLGRDSIDGGLRLVVRGSTQRPTPSRARHPGRVTRCGWPR